jgi:hypothetical protein
MTQDEKETVEAVDRIVQIVINLSNDRDKLLKALQKAYCKSHGCLTNMSWYELMDEIDDILDEVLTQAELKEWEQKMMTGDFK